MTPMKRTPMKRTPMQMIIQGDTDKLKLFQKDILRNIDSTFKYENPHAIKENEKGNSSKRPRNCESSSGCTTFGGKSVSRKLKRNSKIQSLKSKVSRRNFKL